MNKFTTRWLLKSSLLLLLIALSKSGYSTSAKTIESINKRAVVWPITGRVVTAAGDPLPGVTVIIKGTTTGTATGGDGTFSLSAPETPGTLVISFIGYTNQEVPFNGPGNFNVTLRDDAKALEEVVVIGYGTQKKEDLTGAVTAISEKDFNPGQVTSPEQLITGKVAGVQITSAGGAPGSGNQIRIRGGASLFASNDPLIVLDGVPLDNTAIAGSSNPLSMINPNDIESMNILKDASATAIYGSRASNGVIIITTKKGKAGDAFRVGFSTLGSVSAVTKTVDVFQGDEFREVVNQYATDVNKNLLGNSNTDWQDLVFQKAYTTDNNLSFSGAYKSLPYRLSIGYLNQEGILITSKMQRTSAALSLSPSFLDDHLKINLNVKGSTTENRFADEGAIGTAASFDPTQPVYQEGSRFGGYFEWVDAAGVLNTNAPRNPVSLLNQRDNRGNVKRSIGNVQLDYKFHFLPDLRANLNVGYDISRGEGRDFRPATLAGVATQGGSDLRYEQDNINKLADFYLNYVKEIGAINSRIDFTAGYSYQSFNYQKPVFATLNVSGDTISQPGITGEYTNVLIGLFGRLNYTFKNKYLLTANIRRDGTSRFGPDNRWGTFPSVALGWRIVEEPWMAGATFISDLKLRAGYGITGQQNIGQNTGQQDILPLYYPFLARYGGSGSEASYQFGNQFYNTLRPAGYDENIKWEETTTYNAGLDFGFANNRVTGSIDYYFKKTNDLVAEITFPAGANLTNLLVTNVGNLENRGVEALVAVNLVNTERTQWSVGFNGTYNQNEITNLSKTQNSGSIGYLTGAIGGGVGNTIQINSVGYPRNAFYVYKQVYTEDGTPLERTYVDLNNDGLVNSNDLYRYEQTDPQVFLGLNSQVTYGKFNAGFVMRASFGNYLYNNRAAGAYYNNVDWTGYLLTIPTSVRETGFIGEQSERQFSDIFVENASFLRLDNINLGYNFGKVYRDRANVRVSFTGQNLFVITKYKGLDPEISSGIENTFYPRPRTFALGLNLDF